MSKDCSHCGIYSAKNPFLRELLKITVIGVWFYDIITFGAPRFCSSECEYKYYENKGKEVPNALQKMVNFLIRLAIVSGILFVIILVNFNK